MVLNISRFQMYCLEKTKLIEQPLIHSHSVLFLMSKNVPFKDGCFHSFPVTALMPPFPITSFDWLSGT